MTPRTVDLTADELPANLRAGMNALSLMCVYAIGDLSVLHARVLGLICSIQCPGSIVIKTFDAIRALRDDGVVVMGGFHSPMERECLDILLRGDQPVVLCAARSLHGLRIGQQARQALETGKLLLISPFDRGVSRTNRANAMMRNELVAATADAMLIPHASPSGKSWSIIPAAIDRGQRVFTFEDAENLPLLQAGVETLPVPFTL